MVAKMTASGAKRRIGGILEESRYPILKNLGQEGKGRFISRGREVGSKKRQVG